MTAYDNINGLPVISLVNEDEGLGIFGTNDWIDAGSPVKFVLGEGWLEIYSSTFMGTDLEEIYLPASLTTIGSFAFNETPKLEIISFQSGSQLTFIGMSAFQDATKLKSITIPSGVTTISDMTFAHANNLKHVKLETDSLLNRIGMYAFSGADLQSIYLPTHVNYIAFSAFDKNDNLLTVHTTENVLDQINMFRNQLETDVTNISFGNNYEFFGANDVTIKDIGRQQGGRKLRRKRTRTKKRTKKRYIKTKYRRLRSKSSRRRPTKKQIQK